MINVELVGAVAAVLTTASFLPQAVKVLRTRETEAISLAMYALFTTGVAAWLAYGLLTMQWSIIAANALTLLLSGTILAMKIRAVFASARKSG